MTEKNLAIDAILDKFVEYKRDSIKNNGKSGDSADQYRQVINAFEVDGAFVPKDTNKEEIIKANVSKNFLELVPKFINKTKVCVNNKEYDINNVIAWVEKYTEQYAWVQNGKKSYQTYINNFLEFIKDVCKNKNSYKNIYDVCSKENFSSSDFAILSGDEGDIYLHNKLATKFKSRLRSQDRTSGDKIWLPLRFIAKIYSKDKKNHDKNANKNGKKVNQFSNWLDMLVNDIHIHYIENNKVKKISFGGEKGKDDVHLCLVNHFDNGVASDEFDVYVRWINKKGKVIQRHVLTPTGKGNEKKEMIVSGIQAIAIDHVKPIDLTLRDLESKKKLRTLKKVSDKYKELCENDELEEDDIIGKIVENNEIDLEKLKGELDLIQKDGLLRLMDSKYNSKKSNGETFQKIILKDNTEGPKEKEYVGIIEAEAEIYDDKDKRVYYYQKLTDMVSNKNIFHVTRYEIKGTEQKGRKALKKILNLI